MEVYPDIEWYSRSSSKKAVSPRCPFANVYRCPRYYQSLSLLGMVGITTKIDNNKDKELLRIWQKSEYWPVVAEHSTTISGTEGEKKHFTHFCPEISYDVFGLFASSLHRYAVDIDRENAQRSLSVVNQPHEKDWRWEWAFVESLHYSECPLYAPLLNGEPPPMSEEHKSDILQVKPGFWGISLDVKQLISRIFKWWNYRKG